MATINGTFNSLIAGTLSGTVATPGATGPAGPAGPAGPQGEPGVGVPSGGLEGQVLLKASDTSYDTAWFDNYAATVQATVRNETGATLSKGTVVYISGGSGNKPLVSKASASTEAGSSKTFAILAQDIPTNQNGQAVTMGLIKGLDTTAFTAGANLWLSTTAGEIVSPTPPATPAHAVFLGNVVRVHATQGKIEVRIQNGYELGELHDVLIDDPANGQVLKYDAAQGLWINGTDVGGVAWGGITGTLSDQTDLQSALDAKQSVSGMTAYLTKAGNLAGLTDLTAARDNLNLGTANTPVFAGLTVQGSGSNVANLTPTSLTLTHATAGQFTIQPSQGIVFPDSTIQTTAYTGTAAATWGSITGTLSSQTDLQSALNLKANLASPALTGSVTITTNSSSPALVITQDGTGDVVQFKDVTSDTTYSFINANGKLNTIASTTAGAGFNVPHGTAPTSPSNGDLWTTTANLFARINGTTQTMATQSWVSATYAPYSLVNPIVYNQQASLYDDFSLQSYYNNYFLTVDKTGSNTVTATMSSMTTGSKVIFRQANTDQIVFNPASAYQNKTASAGINAIVTAYFDGTTWHLEGDLAYVPYGYVYSSSCVYAEGYDAINVWWTGYWVSQAIIADGAGGTTNTSTTNANGCWYPSGYVTYVSSTYSNQDLYWEVFDSSYNQVANGYSTYSYQYDADVADGTGGTTSTSGNTWQAPSGYLFTSGNYYDSNYGQTYNYDVYSDGGSGYYLNQYPA